MNYIIWLKINKCVQKSYEIKYVWLQIKIYIATRITEVFFCEGIEKAFENFRNNYYQKAVAVERNCLKKR